MNALKAYHVLNKLPPKPFVGAQYVDTQTTTTNETTTTFSGFDIGQAHPFRVVCVFSYVGVAIGITVLVNGLTTSFVRQDELIVAWVKVPSGLTADIEISAVGSTRKFCAVYILYPDSHMPLVKGTVSAAGTNDAIFTNSPVAAGGCFLYACSQGVLGSFTTTWTEADAVVEDRDSQLEASSSFTCGHINITESSNTNTLTIAESTSGVKRAARVTWGP